LIQQFFKRFPEYSNNKMYISSESYGGHYMPTLAREIVDQNTAGQNPKLNFKGFAVGNPMTETYSGFPAMMETYWGHQMLPGPSWKSYQDECVNAKLPNVTLCEALFYEFYLGVGNINPYAIDYPVCTEDARRGGRGQRYALLDNMLGDSNHKLREKMLGNDWDGSYEACEDNWATTYMNLPEVQMHIYLRLNISLY
jgi:hypothetical protein